MKEETGETAAEIEVSMDRKCSTDGGGGGDGKCFASFQGETRSILPSAEEPVSHGDTHHGVVSSKVASPFCLE